MPRSFALARPLAARAQAHGVAAPARVDGAGAALADPLAAADAAQAAPALAQGAAVAMPVAAGPRPPAIRPRQGPTVEELRAEIDRRVRRHVLQHDDGALGRDLNRMVLNQLDSNGLVGGQFVLDQD